MRNQIYKEGIMKYTKFNIALALSIGVLSCSQAFSQETALDKLSAIKPVSCTSKSCNSVKTVDNLSSCDNCNGLSKAESRNMNQVYSYPYAIYGTNNHVGEKADGVTVSSGIDDNMGKYSNAMSKGVPLADSHSIKNSNVTGAAANIPTIGSRVMDFLEGDVNEENTSPKINIETESSQQVLMRNLKPYYGGDLTGAAAPAGSMYNDVPDNFWANPEINKLTRENIAFGYPNGDFRPNAAISRAEFASLIVRGMNMEDAIKGNHKYSFKDVPKNHWAYNIISAAKANDLMTGYPDGTFKPDNAVSKIEAMTMLSKKLDSNMTKKQAEEILAKYSDGNRVPDWAKVNVAKVLEANALEDMPNPDKIYVGSNASRAEVASMLDNIRVTLGYSNDDKSIAEIDDGQKYVASEEIVSVPTLKLVFKDIVSSHSATVGEQFAATTLEDVVIDGVTFKAGSTVRGKVSEVVRPTKDNDGSIKLSFETIHNDGMKANLPAQVLAAQVNQIQQPGFGVRLVQMPFTWLGGLIGNAGRMVGGAAISVSNAAEQTLNGIGMANGELAGGNFKAAGRSIQDVGKTIVKAPVDMVRTAVAGTVGVFQETGSEIAYVVDWNGRKISTIKPKQEVTISFGCYK